MSNEVGLDDEHLSRVFNALGNPIRLRILDLVAKTERPLHIKAIANALQMDYAAAYRHIDVLKKAGLMRIYEVGRSRVLSLLHRDTLDQLLSLGSQIRPE